MKRRSFLAAIGAFLMTPFVGRAANANPAKIGRSCIYPCWLRKRDGNNATGIEAEATYTYDVFDMENPLAIGLSPMFVRPRGVLIGPANSGLYTFVKGELKLVTTDELIALDPCPF